MILRKLKLFFEHKLAKIAMSVLITLFLIILIIPLFFDFESFKPEIENQISQKFLIKVKINDKIVYRPFFRPHIRLSSIDLYQNVKKDDGYIGNIDNINLDINIFDIILKKIIVNNIEITNGIIELPNNYIDNFSKNFLAFSEIKKISVDSLDLKYQLNNGFVELNDIKGEIKINDNFLKEIHLTTNLFNFPIFINFQGSKYKDKNQGKFYMKIPSLEFILHLTLEDFDILKNKYLGKGNIKFENPSSSVGLNNLHLDFNLDLKDDVVFFDKVLINSYLFEGSGSGKVLLKPNLYFNTEFNFKNTNFKKLSNLNLKKALINYKLFRINENLGGSLKLHFEKISTSQNLFNKADAQINLEGGDVIVQDLILSSNDNDQLKINGRFINEDKETMFFINCDIFISNLKNFYKKTNGPRDKIAILASTSFHGKMNSNLNMKKGIIVINDLISENKKLSKNIIKKSEEEINKLLNKNILNILDPRIYSILF
jgi:AsmA family